MKKLSTTLLGAAALATVLTACGGSSAGTSGAQSTTAAEVVSAARELQPSGEGGDDHERVSYFENIFDKLRALPVLQPLFDLYGIPAPTQYDEDDDVAGLRKLLREVSIRIRNGAVTLTNRATGGVIYAAPLSDLGSGTFHPENLPGGSGGATCSAFTYSAWSACTNGTQTRAVLTSSPAGCTGGSPVLTQACSSGTPTCTGFTYSAWGTCTNGTQTRTVLTSSPTGCAGGTPVLSQACSSTPPTCTGFTYSAWGTCTNGAQTRTVLTSSPSGCTGGSPVLSQACSSTPDGAALYGTYCARCHGALAGSNLKGLGISLSSIKSFNMTQGLTDAQLGAIVTAVGP